MKKLTPVIFVPEIEPCLSFWTDRLGYEVHMNVKDGDKSGFVLLLKDDVQVMYQTHGSLATDLPQLEDRDLKPSAFLYITVDDVDSVEKALEGLPLVQERRKTFYGATEIAVREPAGNVVVFAQHDR
jgi:catechol 2,3-dioxygenase-like lactoylglutathione lyase family enzyme